MQSTYINTHIASKQTRIMSIDASFLSFFHHCHCCLLAFLTLNFNDDIIQQNMYNIHLRDDKWINLLIEQRFICNDGKNFFLYVIVLTGANNQFILLLIWPYTIFMNFESNYFKRRLKNEPFWIIFRHVYIYQFFCVIFLELCLFRTNSFEKIAFLKYYWIHM